MFGSNDDKHKSTPAAPASAEKPAEKKDLFGWLRKKPQAPANPDTQPTPVDEPPVAPVAPVTPLSDVAVPVVEPVVVAEAVVEPQPAPVAPVEHVAASAHAEVESAEANALPRPSRFRINAGSEVLHAHVEVPVVVEPVVEPPVAAPAVVEPVAAPAKSAEESRTGFLERLKQGLSKTSASLGEGMASLFLGKKVIDDDLLEDLETRLLTADVGVEATTAIIGNLTKRVARKELADSGALYKALQDELTTLLKPVEQPLKIDSSKQPYVILVVGVNGAGKTTTIGKLAKKLQQDGKKVMLAAGDTFRAAAVEQLQVWGERNQIAVIAQHTGADSASVIFDAVQAAKARGMDVLIADTAGRLHTKDNLMEELKKVRRVIGKLDDTAPHEVLLVLDAGTGQNAISQAKQFNQTVNLTGLALTKLDGTAKGGVIFALAKQFALPIRYIGVGEGIDDLRTFEAEAFVQALFAEK
ncbi:signal recognition particle-docking protein FtsY [Pseudomonas sp. SL4(2022)]|uniref:signal recognition particle-docking protein FtsY n=1 Tax=Pseudomonas sp. SL4(2022) TaxID=2994661 RepID=UPI00226D83B7|nr:signal recognition particle-docking protein FtsY [Pseudomonas sp. SL4(2022)]WAC46503.1 signal recognition particle-docking protein FtsY [Pseudomonas sp. SL4(2022)]